MTVYIEYVIIDNMVFDCLILWAVAKTLKNRTKLWRILLGGVVGTLCAVVSVFVGSILNVVLKIVCLVAMCLCLCGFKRKLFWHILLTLAYTFVMGGAVVGLFFLLKIEFSLENVLTYSNSVPFGVYLLAIVLVAFLIYSTVLYVDQRRKIQRHVLPATLHMSRDYKVFGFCDSGNSLQIDGIPVCFVVGRFKKTIADEIALALLNDSLRHISYVTMAGETSAVAIACKLTIFQTSHDILLAIPKADTDLSYDILLHSSF